MLHSAAAATTSASKGNASAVIGPFKLSLKTLLAVAINAQVD
jgi:hypothetical protein